MAPEGTYMQGVTYNPESGDSFIWTFLLVVRPNILRVLEYLDNLSCTALTNCILELFLLFRLIYSTHDPI